MERPSISNSGYPLEQTTVVPLLWCWCWQLYCDGWKSAAKAGAWTPELNRRAMEVDLTYSLLWASTNDGSSQKQVPSCAKACPGFGDEMRDLSLLVCGFSAAHCDRQQMQPLPPGPRRCRDASASGGKTARLIEYLLTECDRDAAPQRPGQKERCKADVSGGPDRWCRLNWISNKTAPGVPIVTDLDKEVAVKDAKDDTARSLPFAQGGTRWQRTDSPVLSDRNLPSKAVLTLFLLKNDVNVEKHLR